MRDKEKICTLILKEFCRKQRYTDSRENSGIGYLINCPVAVSSELGRVGDEVTVYVYQSVKEDDISLYGFATREQKDMFLKLITVSGIGPKVAHSICGSLSPEQLAVAVMGSNVGLLTSVKGLNRKTAERIILELKDKVTAQVRASGSTVTAASSVLLPHPALRRCCRRTSGAGLQRAGS